MNHLKREYDKHVWNHEQDPFQLAFDNRRKLTKNELSILKSIVVKIKTTEDDTVLAAFLKENIAENGSDLTALLLQICGLTRTKIITDLKPYKNVWKVPSVSGGYKRLHLVDSWQKSGPYLAASLRRVLDPLTRYDNLAAALEAINQATYPGYIRQQRAKESGHQAEYRLAVVLRDVKMSFEPAIKSEQPIGSDVKIYDMSIDLVVPSVEAPKILIISAVHASESGGYGEEKSKAVERCKATLKEKYLHARPPLLLALVDGVGMSNTALARVLGSADEFCQLSTLWKAVVIAADEMGLQSNLFGPENYFTEFQPFLDRYPSSVRPRREEERPEGSVEAGRAYVSVT